MGIPKPPPSLHLSPTPHHWLSLLFHPICSLPASHFNSQFLYNFMAFSLSTSALLHHLTRFSCFLDTWALSTGTTLHHHHLLQPDLHSLQIQLTHIHKPTQHSPLYPTVPLITNATPNTTILIMANNFSTPPSTSATVDTNTTNTTIINMRQQNMGSTQNSQSSNTEPLSFPSTLSTTQPHFFLPAQYMQPYHQSMQFSCTYPLEQAPSGQSFVAYPVYPFWLYGQNGIEIGAGNGVPAGSCFWQPNGLAKEQQRGCLDPQRTKIARIKRKLARQRSLNLQRNASSGATSIMSSSTHMDARRLAMYGTADVNTNRDLYKFCTPDNKRLRVLLRKELKNSDVGSLGRIVLPKREAEENLPSLCDKEGIQVVMRDAFSDQVWTLKFKYWSNNKSRMYVLENTGDFVKQNRLEIGDSLTLYEDENKNLYFSIAKVEKQARPASEPSCKQTYSNFNHTNYNYPTLVMNQDRDEEEASLAILIEQLKHKEQQEAYNLMTLPMDSASSYRKPEEANNGPFNNITNPGINPHLAESIQPQMLSDVKMNDVDDHQNNNIDDCYGGLGMLPDVNRYNFSL